MSELVRFPLDGGHELGREGEISHGVGDEALAMERHVGRVKRHRGC